jgi:hypothetical protein
MLDGAVLPPGLALFSPGANCCLGSDPPVGREASRHAAGGSDLESEADLQRYRSWLAKIQARDYFQAALGPTAQRALERCTSELARFEQDAFEAETATSADTPPAQRSDAPETP